MSIKDKIQLFSSIFGMTLIVIGFLWNFSARLTTIENTIEAQNEKTSIGFKHVRSAIEKIERQMLGFQNKCCSEIYAKLEKDNKERRN